MLRFIPPIRLTFALVASAASFVLLPTPDVLAETWALPGGGSWNLAIDWSPASIPNGIGASAIFNGAATAANPAQSANRTITLDGPQTVGSILFNNDLSTFTNSLTTGAGGSLAFDEAGAGPATITTTGTGTGNNSISAAITLNDSLVAVVNNTAATSASGSLNLTAAISGPGGFTKQGDGTATFGTAAKTYTGATILSGGRMRISVTGQPAASSSFTVNAGAQLTPIVAGTYILGAGTLNLNGSGATTGPIAAFVGAIRQDSSLAVTISNTVNLQSDTLLHVQGSASGSLTFSSSISGVGRLTFTTPSHDANLGSLVLQGANNYSGGTTVNGGILRLSGSAASLGTGDVTVVSANAAFATSSARVTIETGVLDAIANTATLSLAGGNVATVADDGFIELQAGVNEVIGGLRLGGVTQAFGTYGSNASVAAFKFDEYFSGSGIVTVIPEPSAVAMLLTGISALASIRRRRV